MNKNKLRVADVINGKVVNRPATTREVESAGKEKIDKECIEQSVVKDRYRNLIDTVGQ